MPHDRRADRVTPPEPGPLASNRTAELALVGEEILHGYVADITCTRSDGYRGHCGRTVTATLFEIQNSRPCPLCRACPECYTQCGDIEHGMAR